MSFAVPARARLDLHLHTSASDGRYPLDEVLRRCAAGRLDLIALTDHDLGASLPPGPIDVDGHTVTLLPGAELSGVHDGREYHLLVYFPRGVPAGFADHCARQCEERTQRFQAAARALGVDDSLPPGAVAPTRFHLAERVVAAGLAQDRRHAFDTLLGDHTGLVPPLSLPYVEAIRVARSHGGLTSWAHPPRQAVERHLDAFVDAGLQGLEAVRPRVAGTERRWLRKLARRRRLFLTGGSDWHGWGSTQPGLFHVQPDEVRGFLDAVEAA